MNTKTGGIAIATAGHDKNQIYVIVGQQERYFLLADGKQKTLEEPKMKNRKHAQLVENQVYSLEESFEKGEAVTNEMIKRAVKLYKKACHTE